MLNNLKTFYATFGQGQYLGLLKDYYVEINAVNISDARELMVEAFGQKWSNIYPGSPSQELYENKLGILTQQS